MTQEKVLEIGLPCEPGGPGGPINKRESWINVYKLYLK